MTNKIGKWQKYQNYAKIRYVKIFKDIPFKIEIIQ